MVPAHTVAAGRIRSAQPSFITHFSCVKLDSAQAVDIAAYMAVWQQGLRGGGGARHDERTGWQAALARAQQAGGLHHAAQRMAEDGGG